MYGYGWNRWYTKVEFSEAVAVAVADVDDGDGINNDGKEVFYSETP